MEKKEKKQKKQDKGMLDILPYAKYDNISDAFLLQDGTYTDMLMIRAKDWYHATEDDKAYEIAKWTKFYRIYPGNVKIVTMRFRCHTYKQQIHLRKRMNCVRNEMLRGELERKLRELIILEQENYEREFYLCFWGESAADIRKNRYSIMSALGHDIVTTMDSDVKKDILFKMNNKNSRMV